MLTLLLLGPPEVRHAGGPATFATRKALALLIYLAVEGGAHSRENLMALLWPEGDSERARMALRRNLAYPAKQSAIWNTSLIVWRSRIDRTHASGPPLIQKEEQHGQVSHLLPQRGDDRARRRVGSGRP